MSAVVTYLCASESARKFKNIHSQATLPQDSAFAGLRKDPGIYKL